MTNIGAVAGIIPADNGEITMGIRKISEREQLRRSRQRAMSIDDFCERYGVGRTTTYEEIKAERLRARKCGKRTVITEDDAEDWLLRLPAIEPRAAS
jgi:excisionase family DNA binding protein